MPLYVFDLLYLDGRDLTGMPLRERRAKLASLLSARPSPVIRFPRQWKPMERHFSKSHAHMIWRALSPKGLIALTDRGDMANGRKSNASRATASSLSALSRPRRCAAQFPGFCLERAKAKALFMSVASEPVSAIKWPAT
ncbi:hypothetical protein DEA98_29290 (plasmid) [Brucella pseudogrignonensis]|nr:hypothetical protein [Brucella pseudogrignonensis]